MSIYPPFDFPAPTQDGQEYFPVEGETNLGYKWNANDAVWQLIKQIPNPDVTKEYVDNEILKLDGKIEDITDIVAEVVTVTAALDYTFAINSSAIAAYRSNVISCLDQYPTDERDDHIDECRQQNAGVWLNNIRAVFGTFHAIESPFAVDGSLQGGEFSQVHYLKINQKDTNSNTVHWIDKLSGETGAVSVGDFIQIIKYDGVGVDPSNYGFYQVRSGNFTSYNNDETEYDIGLDFEHGKGTLEEGTVYRVRAVKQSNALTADTADDRYLNLYSDKVQQVSGDVRFSPTVDSQDPIYNNQVATKSYVDSQTKISIPIGCITAFAGLPSQIPQGWLWLDGSGFSGSEYPGLSAIFQTNTLPDCRGHHLVGYGAGEYGTINTLYAQGTALPTKPFKTNSYSHSHSVNDGIYVNKDNKSANSGPQVNYTSSGYNQGTPAGGLQTDVNTHLHDINAGGDEVTRPSTIAICWIIKAK